MATQAEVVGLLWERGMAELSVQRSVIGEQQGARGVGHQAARSGGVRSALSSFLAKQVQKRFVAASGSWQAAQHPAGLFEQNGERAAADWAAVGCPTSTSIEAGIADRLAGHNCR